MSQQIKLSDIRYGGILTRVKPDKLAVVEYQDQFVDGSQFPPIAVYYDSEFYWLADGYHRVSAACGLGHETIAAEVLKGTKRDALEHSVKSNWEHGVRRTNADKKKAVELVLADDVWREWAVRKLAEFCGVSNTFIASIRAQLSTDDSCTATPRVGKDGRRRKAPKPKAKPAKDLPPKADATPVADEGTDFDTIAIESAERPKIDIEGLATPYRRWVRLLGECVQEFKQLAGDERTGIHLADKFTRIKHDLNQALSAISEAEPVCICLDCEGAGCQSCGTSGFWTRLLKKSFKR